MSLAEACRRIQLLLSDVDGVMTDGSLLYDAHGNELKSFSVRDGLGIRLWQRAGGRFGIITGRSSPMVTHRCRELDIDILHQGASDKLPVLTDVAEQCGVSLDQIAYIGDDLPDLPCVRAVGLGVAVADAAEELISVADYVTSQRGGRGAVRELVEVILKNSDRWTS